MPLAPSGAPVVDAHRLLGPVPADDVPSTTVPGLLAELDALGIDEAYVTHTYSLFGDPAGGNEALFAAVVREPRLHPVPLLVPATSGAGVPSTMDGVDALAALGVAMVRLTPTRHRFDLDGPIAKSWLRRISNAGIAVAIDLNETSPAALRALAAAHPSLALLVLNPGYRRLRELGELLDSAPAVRLETGSLITQRAVEWIAARWGAQRLVFGTGAPLLDDAGPRFQLDHLDLTSAERDLVAGGSLAGLLRAAGTTVGTRPLAMPSPAGPVLDAHGHIGGWPDFLIPDPTAAGLVAMADRLGVDAIGVSALLALGPDTAVGNRRALAAAEAHPGRLGVWLVANPHQPAPLAELPEQLGRPEVWGIKVHPDAHQCRLDDPGYTAVFELAADKRVPVLAHGQTDTHWSDPAIFADVGRRYPAVPLLLGHAGLWAHGFARAARLVADVPSVYLEICGSRMTARWVARLVEMVGADRIVYGSDACFLDLRVGLGRVLLAPLAEPDRAAVLGGNLAHLLRSSRARRGGDT